MTITSGPYLSVNQPLRTVQGPCIKPVTAGISEIMPRLQPNSSSRWPMNTPNGKVNLLKGTIMRSDAASIARRYEELLPRVAADVSSAVSEPSV